MQHYGSRYILVFALLVCAVCAVFVASAAVGLAERQGANKALDRQRKILDAAGIVPEDEEWSAEQVAAAFAEKIDARVIDLESGRYVSDVDATTFDQRKAAKDPETSKRAPPNPAQVARIPKRAVVYLQRGQGEAFQKLILPVEGKGLWSTLYGFLALDRDLETIEALIFYDHGETPGLGGEVENPRWQSLWKGRQAFDERGKPAIEVIKGNALTPAEDPYRVDGLSGATITSRGVTHLLRFWLGESGFGPYLKQLQGGV